MSLMVRKVVRVKTVTEEPQGLLARSVAYRRHSVESSYVAQLLVPRRVREQITEEGPFSG